MRLELGRPTRQHGAVHGREQPQGQLALDRVDVEIREQRGHGPPRGDIAPRPVEQRRRHLGAEATTGLVLQGEGLAQALRMAHTERCSMQEEVSVLEPARNVLITGASSGIGSATARLLLDRGLRVYGTSRTPKPTGGGSDDIRWLALDVCDDASVGAAVATMTDEVGAIEAVVCNAGVGIFGSVEETPIDAARAQFETNYFGVLRVLRAVLPDMRARGAGRIALVGSLAGRAPIPFQSHYSSTKAAIDALALSLRNEVGPLGLGVSLIEPGDIDTPFNEAMDWGGAEGSAYAERIARCERQIREQLPKAPKPVVVARAIEHALTARRPRVRYAVGDSSWLVPLGRRLLPDFVSLDLIRRTFKV